MNKMMMTPAMKAQNKMIMSKMKPHKVNKKGKKLAKSLMKYSR